ncbi:MAG: bifunctional diaminohydroxyphosphoribosylaminopyrimidine deaminase/5-amino-6-(5-phosphoribosylamino)uracil reductase RibD [Halioglobus sp.]
MHSAGDATGATAYVTLEPCSHHGKTGPCAQALIEAGVSRVVAALQDPNPAVGGGGLQALRAAGLEVECGLLQEEARALIPGFIQRMTRGRGRVRVKMAMSLDGRTAMASGESQWITGPAARADVQRLRASSCAIVTGAGTVLSDDCALTVRAAELNLDAEQTARARVRAPLRVVLDSQMRTPPTAKVLDAAAPTLVCHARGAATAQSGGNAELFALPGGASGLDLEALLAELARRQCNEILVESGPRLAGALLQAGLVDELILYIAPALLGDRARPLFALPLDSMAEKQALEWRDMRRVGNDWRVTAIPLERPGDT